MPVRGEVRRSFYQDSMVLMRLAAELSELPGVARAAALMGTPANRQLLAEAGLGCAALEDAGTDDLMLALDTDTDAAAREALAAASRFFDNRRQQREATGRAFPRTLDAAARQMPGANLALISVPGPHARLEAMSALRRGLHVLIFSDNVALEDEIELKRFAASRRLLCMGPDCGTAYLGGVGLGFANVVPRGRIGCVAASGTGLQSVASHLASLGEGISHGIGVGGRDLSEGVGGMMTRLGLELLVSDPATRVIVLISKPPAARVMEALDAIVRAIDKPVVVCCLGGARPTGAPGHPVSTLHEAAAVAAALARGQSPAPEPLSPLALARSRLLASSADLPRGKHLLGLYSGGTLAHEARLTLEPLLGPIGSESADRAQAGHQILDLGADQFTRARPHPMIDATERAARMREAGRRADVGVVLLDLVLGRGAHPDPAGALAPAIRGARETAAADGRSLAIVASVVGTAGDPQGLAAQTAALESAGVQVLPSNPDACGLAALLVKPELERSVLGAAP